MRINYNSISTFQHANNYATNPNVSPNDSSTPSTIEDNNNEHGCVLSISSKSEAYTEYINKMDSILTKLRNNEEISQKDREWLDGEVQSMLSGQYDNLPAFSFKRQNVLEGLINERQTEEKRMQDLLDQLEKEKNTIKKNNSKLLETEQALNTEAELLEKFTDSMDNKDKSYIYKKNVDDTKKEEYYTDSFIEGYIDKEFERAKNDFNREMSYEIKEWQSQDD